MMGRTVCGSPHFSFQARFRGVRPAHGSLNGWLDGLLSGRTALILTQLPIDAPTIRHLPSLTEEGRVMMAADHPRASRPSRRPSRTRRRPP